MCPRNLDSSFWRQTTDCLPTQVRHFPVNIMECSYKHLWRQTSLSVSCGRHSRLPLHTIQSYILQLWSFHGMENCRLNQIIDGCLELSLVWTVECIANWTATGLTQTTIKCETLWQSSWVNMYIYLLSNEAFYGSSGESSIDQSSSQSSSQSGQAIKLALSSMQVIAFSRDIYIVVTELYLVCTRTSVNRL